MGPIYDRTKEHLGYSDKTIIALRKVLLQAARSVQEGREPPHIMRDASANDFSRLRAVKGLVPANHSWRELLESEKEVA
jgi:phthalate 4,5-dioxygenase